MRDRIERGQLVALSEVYVQVHVSIGFWDDHYGAPPLVARFHYYPPFQKAANFGLDVVM